MSTQDYSTGAQKLSGAIDRVLKNMTDYDPNSKEYGVLVEHLSELYTMKKIDNDFELKTDEQRTKLEEVESNSRLKDAEAALKQKEIENFDRIKKETWAIIGANITGIVLVIGYEHAHVIASKALSFAMKLR